MQQSIGFEPAAISRKILSASVDLLCHALSFMAMFQLIGLLFANKIASAAYDVAEVTNGTYNLLYYVEDNKGDHKTSPSHIFSEDELKEIELKYADYYVAENGLTDESSEEEKAAVVAKEVEAKKYCEIKEMTCNPSEIGSVEQYRELVKKAESDLILLSYSSPLLSAAFGAIIFSFIIPLANSRRQTIGRRLFKLGIVTNKGQTVPWTLLSVRMLIGLIIEFGSSLIIFPPYILMGSLILMLLSKRRYTIKDFFSNTVVVDLAKPTEIVPRLDVV